MNVFHTYGTLLELPDLSSSRVYCFTSLCHSRKSLSACSSKVSPDRTRGFRREYGLVRGKPGINLSGENSRIVVIMKTLHCCYNFYHMLPPTWSQLTPSSLPTYILQLQIPCRYIRNQREHKRKLIANVATIGSELDRDDSDVPWRCLLAFCTSIISCNGCTYTSQPCRAHIPQSPSQTQAHPHIQQVDASGRSKHRGRSSQSVPCGRGSVLSFY